MKHRDECFRHGPALLPLLLTLAAGVAVAHSKQEVTFPEDGAVLATSPDVVSMRFDTPMRITVISLTSETGGAFDLRRSDGMQPVTDFRATTPVLPDGRYTVELARPLPGWPPHEVSFLVRGRAVGSGVWQSVPAMDGATLATVAVKAFAYLASLTAAGSALALASLSALDGDTRRMVRRLGLAGAILAGVASAALIPLGAAYLGGGL